MSKTNLKTSKKMLKGGEDVVVNNSHVQELVLQVDKSSNLGDLSGILSDLINALKKTNEKMNSIIKTQALDNTPVQENVKNNSSDNGDDDDKNNNNLLGGKNSKKSKKSSKKSSKKESKTMNGGAKKSSKKSSKKASKKSSKSTKKSKKM